MADLKNRNLQKGFDGQAIIKGIDLDVRDREFVVFVGPSGCGKSTLLAALSRLLAPAEGRVVLDGRDIHSLPGREV
uniref:ATP-binding cassette domain-containing protein n=1 Tax=Salmonella sp. E393-2 TaxID=3240324 RepID=UPI00352AA4F0